MVCKVSKQVIQNHTTREKPILNTNVSEDGVKACSQTHPG